MPSLLSLLVDPRAHAAVILGLALLRVVYAIVSRVVAPHPRARAAVEAVAALGPDVIRAGQQAAAVLSGRPVPSLDIRAPHPEVAHWRRRAEAAEARVAELAAAAHAAPVDRPRPHSTPPAASLLTLVVLLGLVACGAAREALMTATPGVPQLEHGVDGGTNRCNGAVPEVCVTSGSGVRCWPSLQRDARGRQRVCTSGCALDDAGVAVCLPGDVGDLDSDASEVSP